MLSLNDGFIWRHKTADSPLHLSAALGDHVRNPSLLISCNYRPLRSYISNFHLVLLCVLQIKKKKWDQERIRKRELYSSFNRLKKKVFSNWFPVICNDEPDGTFVVSLTNKRTIRKRDPSINHIITCRLFAIPASLCDENCQTRLLKLFRRRPSHMCETQSSFALKWFRTDSSFETKKSGNSEMGCNTLSLKWLWFENKRYNTSFHKPIHLLQKFYFQLLSQYLKKKTTGNSL